MVRRDGPAAESRSAAGLTTAAPRPGWHQRLRGEVDPLAVRVSGSEDTRRLLGPLAPGPRGQDGGLAHVRRPLRGRVDTRSAVWRFGGQPGHRPPLPGSDGEGVGHLGTAAPVEIGHRPRAEHHKVRVRGRRGGGRSHTGRPPPAAPGVQRGRPPDGGSGPRRHSEPPTSGRRGRLARDPRSARPGSGPPGGAGRRWHPSRRGRRDGRAGPCTRERVTGRGRPTG